ncbi:MAG: alanine racemase [Spirochaetia bacterium]
MRATKAVIRLDFFKANIHKIRSYIGPEPRLCLAVKADAYGHGIIEVGKAASDAGIEYLAVATADEGFYLRESGIKVPLLLYSLPVPEEFEAVAASGITPMAADLPFLREYNRIGKKLDTVLPVHLKVDTGMGRIGCFPRDAVKIISAVTEMEHLALEGISTHFPTADLPDDEFTHNQISIFSGIIKQTGFEGISHAANSGGVLYYPGSYFGMVRPGLLAYGYYPDSRAPRPIDVTPVMQLESRVVFLKKVPKGTPISYGRTYITPRETVIATIPAGYGDGYPRILSNRSEIQINGRRYPVAGRICMDQFMADLGPSPDVSLYDKAVLFGYTDDAPDAQEVAAWAETIPYEITCGISKRVPRVYFGG